MKLTTDLSMDRFWKKGSPLAADLLHYYPLEENGADRFDLLSSATLTTAIGSVGRTTGKQNFGADISVGNTLSDENVEILSSTFTMGFWVKPVSYLEFFGNPCPIVVSSVATSGFDFTRGQGSGETNVTLRVYPGGQSVNVAVGNLLSTGVFHAVMIWATPTTFGFQVDGGTDHTGSGTFNPTNGSFLFSFTSTLGINGVFDELAVWSRVLTAAERAAWYNGGAGSFYPY